MNLFFVIPGKPIAKKRPRFSRSRKKVHVYDEQKGEKDFVRIWLKSQMMENSCFEPLACSVVVDMTFYTPMPSSWSQKKREAKNSQPDPRRPDIDNYVKFYADTMNRIVLMDDSLIVSSNCKKIFSINPRTQIVIKKYTEED